MDARQFWDSVSNEVAKRAMRAGVDFYSIEDCEIDNVVIVYANTGEMYQATVCAIVRGRDVTYEKIALGDLIERIESEPEEA